MALAVVLSLPVAAGAQQTAASAPGISQAYEMSRETALTGTIVQFVKNSSVAPLGAHVVVQTGSGPVDVQLGDPRLLQANSLSLTAGDNVRIIGEALPYGQGTATQFFARVIQKGSQVLNVRSVRGFPLKPMASKSNGGVL
jgi:hypothetical protein